MNETKQSESVMPPLVLGGSPLAAVLALWLLVGCQQEGEVPALSLEEAKQVTAAFEGADFVPPPRTVRDITAILDQQKNAKDPHLEKRRAEADAQPPVTDDKIKLWRFYLNRRFGD